MMIAMPRKQSAERGRSTHHAPAIMIHDQPRSIGKRDRLLSTSSSGTETLASIASLSVGPALSVKLNTVLSVDLTSVEVLSAKLTAFLSVTAIPSRSDLIFLEHSPSHGRLHCGVEGSVLFLPRLCWGKKKKGGVEGEGGRYTGTEAVKRSLYS